MSFSSSSPRSDENKIIAALRRSEASNLFSHLERVTLAQGEVVYEPDNEIEYVYFPETAVFSMLSTMEDGSTVEVGPVGDEGMVGLRIFLGASNSLDRVLVHVAGTAMRLKSSLLREELRSGKSLLPFLLLRYTQMLLAMTSKTAACYQLHPLEEQLARWILMMHDYVRGDELRLTQELIALTLGTRRAGVTEACIKLRNTGVLNYTRRNINVPDRLGMEAHTCECYKLIKEEFDRLYLDLSSA